MRKLLLSLTAFLFLTGTLLAQKTITGRITDPSGNPVPNASIQVRGTTTGTTSKADGTFSLTAPATATDLVISSVGFEPTTVAIQGPIVNVSLRTAANELASVVVTGYSRLKKSEFAGASTKVSGDKINFVPNASFDQILQGKAPGVLVTVGSGQPGAAARVCPAGRRPHRPQRGRGHPRHASRPDDPRPGGVQPARPARPRSLAHGPL